MTYNHKRQLSIGFVEALDRAREELAKEGFGVLTEVDVKATLHEKLGVDFDNYVILGACNPPFAHEALLAERDIGAMLPCNVIVYEQGGKTFVASIRPTVAMGMIQNPELMVVAREIEKKLDRVIMNI